MFPLPEIPPIPLPTVLQLLVPAVVDVNKLAPTLADWLRAGKRDDVFKEVAGLSATDRNALEQVVIRNLAPDKRLIKQAIELRLIIRFAGHPLGRPPARQLIRVTNRGRQVSTTTVRLRAQVTPPQVGTVTLRTGAALLAPGGNTLTDAFSVTYDGPDIDNMRWLQFAWREVIQEFPNATRGGKPVRVHVQMKFSNHADRMYLSTTNPDRPRWSVDGADKNSAFYEVDSTVLRSSSELTLFDEPSNLRDVAKNLFGATPAPARVISHFHAATFLVHRMDVLYRAEIDRWWNFKSPTKVYQSGNAHGGRADELEPDQRACLLASHPEMDYLPGPPIRPPQPADVFEALPSQAYSLLGSWGTQTNVDRYADIAALGTADLIHDVVVPKTALIPSPLILPKAINTGATISRGLNFDAGLADDGETGFINAANVYTRAMLPQERDGRLPQVAIILGGLAFQLGAGVKDKSYPLATMRHEMLHATHSQMAIGWLLRWRDELTSRTFENWIKDENRHGRISDLDLALVLTGVVGAPMFDKRSTEMLAWTEGLVTALPFLPPTPNFTSHMAAEELWPGAVTCLLRAGQEYNKQTSFAELNRAVTRRLRMVICNTLTPVQRNAVKDWITYLQNPTDLPPTPSAKEQRAINKMGDFLRVKRFLDELTTQLAKPCP